jgi:hypothetical protein
MRTLGRGEERSQVVKIRYGRVGEKDEKGTQKERDWGFFDENRIDFEGKRTREEERRGILRREKAKL